MPATRDAELVASRAWPAERGHRAPAGPQRTPEHVPGRLVSRVRAAVPWIPDAWRNDLSDVTRRRTLQLGLAVSGAALLPLQWAASARAAAVPPSEVTAAGDLALWYDQAA